MESYKDISKKKMKYGSTSIMVRFNFQGITYLIKNFTKLYKITTEKDVDIKLGRIKLLLSNSKNPFATTLISLNDIWDDKIEKT
jgi:hypothetical protein